MNQYDDVYEIDLLELLHVLRKRIVVIIAAALIGAGAAAAYSYLIATPVYESTSKIYILTQSTSLTSFADIQISTSLAQDYEEMIYSRPVVAQVCKNLGLDYSYSQLKSMLTVDNPVDTRVLNITCRSTDKEEARDLANEFAVVSKRQIAKIMDTDEPTLFEKAVVSKRPVLPDKKKNIIMGFLIGLVLACMVVIIGYMVNDSIKSEDDVERVLGLQVLASIPKEKTQKVRAIRFDEAGRADSR